MPLDWQPHEVAVRAKMNKTEHLPLRLIILRKSPEATEKTCKRLRRNAIRQQKKLDPRSRVTAEFLILAASLPAEPYPGEEVLAAYRLRWQIALAFKRLKSLLHIDRLPARTPACATASARISWISPRRNWLTPVCRRRGGCRKLPPCCSSWRCWGHFRSSGCRWQIRSPRAQARQVPR